MIRACLLLRDEAHCIASTLHSIAPFVDSFTCVDTGSTDGTPAIVRAIMGQYHVPGDVHARAFRDYAQARNELLDLAEQAAPSEAFLLVIDAEDVLVNGDSLRFMLQAAQPSATCFALRQAWPDGVVHPLRVIRSGSGWRYVGKVHELLTHPEGRGATTLVGPSLRHEPTAIGQARTRARWPRDVALLQHALEEQPGDPRLQWHLDRTLAAMAHAQAGPRN